MKNSNDTNGIRTRDLPACSAVPQLTVPSFSPEKFTKSILLKTNLSLQDDIYSNVWPIIRFVHGPIKFYPLTDGVRRQTSSRCAFMLLTLTDFLFIYLFMIYYSDIHIIHVR